ncbi:calcium-binding protein [Silanimonas sp.]|uniref:calcium-binding protein n=1 Tax=Silanimonas sp. TaxID=1929290 RepID=UPI0022C4F525|nr:calcium-binding protein [Silanimonas sp.]MCZ8164404.1 hypothetical protein [Silanimonas sp.]
MAYQDQDRDDALRGWWQRLTADMRFPFHARRADEVGAAVVVVSGLEAQYGAIKLRCLSGDAKRVILSFEQVEAIDADPSTIQAMRDWGAAFGRYPPGT